MKSRRSVVLRAGATALMVVLVTPTISAADVGDPDSTFGIDGVAMTDFGFVETLYDLAELPDGRLVAVGGSADGSLSDTAIAMYLADGSLDPAFDGDGRVRLDLGTWDEAYGVAVQPGLGILAAGYVDDDLFVVRLDFNGALDPTFGTGGIVQMTIGSFAYAWKVGVDGSGRILLAGAGGGVPRVIRLLANGALDPAFGSGGHATMASGDFAASIAFDSAGRIVTAIEGGLDMRVVRLTTAGLPDASFGFGGLGTITTPNHDRASVAVVDAADRVVIAGVRDSTKALFGRLDATGAPDPTFDGDGVLVLPPIGTLDSANATALQADGAIVFAGSTAGPSLSDIFVGRLLNDGTLDTTFAGDGLVVQDAGGNDQASAVLVDGDGRVVAAGSGGPNGDFVAARYESTAGDDTASGTATPEAGGSASTGTDPTPGDPIETTVTVPPGTVGGPISVTESESQTIPPPSGYEAIGLEVQISAPAGTAANPLELTFSFDQSAALTAGVDELTIQVLRNGVPVADCTSTGPIFPDPCIVERARAVDGDIRVRVDTSVASAWSLAARTPFAFTGFLQPVDNQPVQNSVKAGSAVPVKFKLGGDQGFGIFAATYPRSVGITCGSSSPVDAIEATSTAGSSSLSYDSGTSTYIYTWKTDKKWASSCRQLVVRFADGTSQRASFLFTR